MCMNNTLKLALCALLALVLAGCNSTSGTHDDNGHNKGNGSKPPSGEDIETAIAKFKTADRGHWKAIQDYFAAIRANKSEAMQALLSPYAFGEATAQYGDFGMYVAACRTNLANAGEPIPVRPYPYARPMDSAEGGEMFDVTLKTATGTPTLHIYFVPGANGPVIDNIMGGATGLLTLPGSAPQLGLAIGTTRHAFFHYYYGAMLGEHMASAGTGGLSQHNRAAYLRASCTPRFIATLNAEAQKERSFKGNLFAMLDANASALRNDYATPEIKTEGDGYFEVLYPPSPTTRHAEKMVYRYVVKTVHGQMRLDSYGEVR